MSCFIGMDGAFRAGVLIDIVAGVPGCILGEVRMHNETLTLSFLACVYL